MNVRNHVIQFWHIIEAFTMLKILEQICQI
jgi:hypothetical protein